jgi:hypothetical protein
MFAAGACIFPAPHSFLGSSLQSSLGSSFDSLASPSAIPSLSLPVHRFRIHDPAGPDRLLPPSAAATPSVADPNGSTDGRWSISSCYLIGTDGRPARGAWKQVGDTIYAKPANDTPIGLALLVDAGAGGRVVLQTCFLPAREQPYDLFLEIARWMIKQFVEECETWQMWNPVIAGEAIELWDSARETFREALRCEEPLEAELLARRAIAFGLDAGEALALRHAGYLLSRRARRKALSSTTLGVCVDPVSPPGPRSVEAARRFDVIALRTPWSLIERKEGARDFSAVDAWAAWCAKEKKPVVLGPIIDFGTSGGSPNALPAHALKARGDAKRFRELVWNQARAIAERYGATTPLFIVTSGANCAGWHEEGIERMVDLTRTAIVAVRDVVRGARVVVELQSPGAEEWRGTKGTAWPTSFLQGLVAANLSLTAAGVRFTQGGGADPVRDLMTTASLLDGYVGREVPIFVTGFGVPGAADGSRAALERGVWRGRASDDSMPAWSPESQARWGASFLSIALARTFVEGAWWSRLQDVRGGPSDGVIDVDGNPKPVLARLLEIRQRLERDAKAQKAAR